MSLGILGVLERELTRKFYFAKRPIGNWMRSRAFAASEAAGTDLSGQWDETMLRRNDTNAF